MADQQSPNVPNADEMQARQNAHFEKARRGVLKFIDEKGGTLPMSDLHDFCLNKFFIQHQRFSELMESLVNEQLVEFDWTTRAATITKKGKKFIEK